MIAERLIQIYRFNGLKPEFEPLYSSLRRLGREPYVIPFWQAVNKDIEAAFLPNPKIDFLNAQAIKNTMLVDGSTEWLETQVNYLQKKLGSDFEKVLKESVIGKPPRLPAPLNFTSHNKIHHLYHIYFYLERSKVKPNKIHTVVEWGGGYGNFAVLWWRLNPESTYIIIDTALFCTVQWLYLSSVLGENQVNLLASKKSSIVPGKINIVPLALLDKLKISGDLFVSTWGLSESTAQAQDYVVKKVNWFNCPHLLIGYQNKTKELVYASRLGELAKKDGAKIIDIKFLPNNHYAFR